VSSSFTYAAAGVDTEAGEKAVALMRAAVEAAQRPETIGHFGGFAGLFDASVLTRFTRPLLATSTDGVGTKIAVARAMGVHHTIGRDLVAMVVDDIVVCGAEPLFMTDYIAIGKVNPELVADIVRGIADGCVLAGCALLGGETAEHPGLMKPDEYDVAGAGTGVVEASELLGPDRVKAGDVAIAMASSGLHSNGYSLARRVLLDHGGLRLEQHLDDLGRSLGEELLEPTRIYTLDCLALATDPAAHLRAFSHITGGGVAANVARVLPEHLALALDRSTWRPPTIIDVIARTGPVERLELERTFNMGIGMLAVVAPDGVARTLALLAERGVPAWVVGEIAERTNEDRSDAAPKGGSGGVVSLTGDYRT
jgi:phosphoribosylformylglycinamidine cyclo-ligase